MQVLCCDGVAFLKDKEQQYDVIIIDSSGPRCACLCVCVCVRVCVCVCV
jgi:predicted membrane-bound spermidine synthase